VHALTVVPKSCAGVLIWPVDHPFVRETTVQALLRSGGRVRQPTLEGRGGHPIWIERALYAQLPQHLDGGTLRDLVAGVPVQERTRIDVADFGVRFNCNEASDWDSGCARWHQGE
jgi:CTP:molybdopterin cytidylyltransferase MocA